MQRPGSSGAAPAPALPPGGRRLQQVVDPDEVPREYWEGWERPTHMTGILMEFEPEGDNHCAREVKRTEVRLLNLGSPWNYVNEETCFQVADGWRAMISCGSTTNHYQIVASRLPCFTDNPAFVARRGSNETECARDLWHARSVRFICNTTLAEYNERMVAASDADSLAPPFARLSWLLLLVALLAQRSSH